MHTFPVKWCSGERNKLYPALYMPGLVSTTVSFFYFTGEQTTTITCEDYSELCEYELYNFRIACFGDCDRPSPFDPSPIDMESLWEECGGEAEITDR